jgi:hypothetical protein
MNPNAVFAAILMAIMAYAVWEARSWNPVTRTFPTVIGFVLLVLLAVEIVVSIRKRPRVAEVPKADEPAERELAVEGRRQRAFVVWLLAFGAAVWLLSFPIGGTLATFAYLKTNGERWRTTLAITIGTAAFFWIMTNLLNIFFPPALLLDFIPI